MIFAVFFLSFHEEKESKDVKSNSSQEGKDLEFNSSEACSAGNNDCDWLYLFVCLSAVCLLQFQNKREG
jgi:hypothetical protein